MRKIAEFIVKRYWLFLILFAALIVYCVFGIPKVKVEYDITNYLPSDTDTAQALKIMDAEFVEYGSATVLVKDVDREKATELADRIKKVDGVVSFSFDANSPSNYKDGNALFGIYFSGGSDDARAVRAYNEVVDIISSGGCAFSVPVPLVNNYADTLASEMIIIIAIAAAVIIAVLLFTSKSFAEVLAFPVIFIVAAVLNMGTNHWLGTISFVSNTVCIILQLALAIDYAIILCHRFTEEKDKRPNDARGAMVNALAKAIPEISSSSLTTVSGLVALMFMQLGLGFDLGMVLAKSIICSLLTVFLLMPSILLLLSKLMDKSRHRNLVPRVWFLGSGVVKIRYALIAVFFALFGVGAWLSQTVTYCYSQNSIDTSRPTAVMTAKAEAEKLFGANNAFVVLVPSETAPSVQREIIAAATAEPLVTSALGWAGIALPSRTVAGKSYYLTDEINYKELDDIAGIGDGAAALVFSLYALDRGDNPAELAEYKAQAAELFEYVFGNDFLMSMAGESISAYKQTLEFGKSQLVGTKHDRIIFNVDSSVESAQTFALIKRIMPTVRRICPQAIFAGESMSAYDLNESFSHDNILISLLTVAFIYLILAFTFRSWGIPAVLVLVIQGAIFMNFSLPAIMGNNLFFFTYLIVSAIQMGATIDYAILLTNRFRQLKTRMPRGEAVKQAISTAFPTVMTSGTIMTVAAFLVGFLTSDPLISSMGMTLGTGTLISIICVLTALPALLYALDPLLEKTVIKRKLKAKDIKMPNPSLPPSM